MPDEEGAVRPLVLVQPDPESLARFAARRLAEEIQESISTRGECVAALPGGKTPGETLEMLAGVPGVDWARAILLPADERLVDVSDPESNEGLLRRSLVERLSGDRPMVLGWQVEEGLGPETLSKRFEGRLLGVLPFVEGRPQLDVLALGLGLDGHTASLFPGREWPQEAVVLATTNPTGQSRLSLGPLVLRSARHTHFLAEGEGKAEVIRQVIEGDYDPLRLPAQLVARNVPGCELWCDRAAASLLGERP